MKPDDLMRPYEPALIYYEEADAAEYVTDDVPCLYEFVSPGVALVRRIDTREIIGFRIECPKAWGESISTPTRDAGRN